MLLRINALFRNSATLASRELFARETERRNGRDIKAGADLIAASSSHAVGLTVRLMNASGQRMVLQRIHYFSGEIVREPCESILDDGQWSIFVLSADAVGFLVYRIVDGDALTPTSTDAGTDVLIAWRVGGGRFLNVHSELSRDRPWTVGDVVADEWIEAVLNATGHVPHRIEVSVHPTRKVIGESQRDDIDSLSIQII
ncbi:hypothetical protein [Robbsia sp. KACC 23696]|uniref:hypothetical protein n=1 Tax=Robbsia sp. KACC 23696 TaxID=3149231 RepID=UPI00325A9B24